jgi:hypothetical protein
LHRSIVTRFLIPIGHAQRYGCAQGPAIFNARQNGNLVGFVPVGRQTALAGTTPIKLGLDIFFAERQSGGTAVYHRANTFTVRLTKSCYLENGSKCA